MVVDRNMTITSACAVFVSKIEFQKQWRRPVIIRHRMGILDGDVTIWKRLSRSWPYARGIHQLHRWIPITGNNNVELCVCFLLLSGESCPISIYRFTDNLKSPWCPHDATVICIYMYTYMVQLFMVQYSNTYIIRRHNRNYFQSILHCDIDEFCYPAKLPNRALSQQITSLHSSENWVEWMWFTLRVNQLYVV